MKQDDFKIQYLSIPDEAKLISVEIGKSASVSDKKTYVGTFGLGPCTAVAVSIEDAQKKIHKFVAHIDIGETLGTIEDLILGDLRQFAGGIKNIKNAKTTLVSSESFRDKNNLTGQETKLLNAVKIALAPVKQQIPDFTIGFDSSSVVQIQPNGQILIPDEKILDKEQERKIHAAAASMGVIIDPALNIYVHPEHGAWTTEFSTTKKDLELSISLASLNEDILSYIIERDKAALELLDKYGVDDINDLGIETRNEFFQEYILIPGSKYFESELKNGRVLKLAESFRTPGKSAVYMENYKDMIIAEYGKQRVPGCPLAVRATELLKPSPLFDDFETFDFGKSIKQVLKDFPRQEFIKVPRPESRRLDPEVIF
ncbi:MAG: hypothetical protein FWE31_00840 [Firmicutes bacterium]|nr:hypothetical protein [Bacillota bacterium]